MAFSLSPGVEVREFSPDTIIPNVDVTTGGIAGVFSWGPVKQRRLITSEDELVATFGRPTESNYETYYTAASFLAYTSSLWVVRAANTSANATVSAYNAAAYITTPNIALCIVENEDRYDAVVNSIPANVFWVARYPGAIGNSLRVSQCDHYDQYARWVNLAAYGVGSTFRINVGSYFGYLEIPCSSNTDADANGISAMQDFTVGDLVYVGNNLIRTQELSVQQVFYSNTLTDTTRTGSPAFLVGNTATVRFIFDQKCGILRNWTNNVMILRRWEHYRLFPRAPNRSTYQTQYGNASAYDEIYVVVVDQDGVFTKTPKTVLETYTASRAIDAKDENGDSTYYRTRVNEDSKYMWFAKDRGNAASANAKLLQMSGNRVPYRLDFALGADGSTESTMPIEDLADGYDYFANPADVDVGLIMQGKSRGANGEAQLANYLIDNIAETRKDCVIFASPEKADVFHNFGEELNDVVEWADTVNPSSYAFLDTGYKTMYDRYNNAYRSVPLNGDMAGLAARTDRTNDPWWSFAGHNRGILKNVVKLTWNPSSKAVRDVLYSSRVNPVMTVAGEGTFLYGDKTALDRPSAFDRINVRRLFIVLEKAIARAAKYMLFEFNDAFTRAQFKNMVEPYLRDIQGRRGIQDYLVVCDESNNTGTVIDRNEFIGDIYVKPARSINFIQLNFIVVGTSASFTEVVGKFG